MSKKHIRITIVPVCSRCPNNDIVHRGSRYERVCTARMEDGKFKSVEQLRSIPDWCPLPDNEEDGDNDDE